jgi:hypothetical protein
MNHHLYRTYFEDGFGGRRESDLYVMVLGRKKVMCVWHRDINGFFGDVCDITIFWLFLAAPRKADVASLSLDRGRVVPQSSDPPG